MFDLDSVGVMPSQPPLAFDPIERAGVLWERNWPGEPDEVYDSMRAVTSIMRAHQILIAELDARLRPYGITFSRYEALVLLMYSHAGSLPLSKIGERLQVHATSVTNVIDRLEVLNKISETAMRQVLPEIARHQFHLISNVATYPVTHLDGDVITLHTPKGSLRYTVRGAFAVAKPDAGYVRPLMAQHTRNRVVIITCGELHGVDYDYNVVVNAYLTSPKATPART